MFSLYKLSFASVSYNEKVFGLIKKAILLNNDLVLFFTETLSLFNCSLVASIVDRTYLYDNSPDFQEPVLLFRVKDGRDLKIYEAPNSWAIPILNSLKSQSQEG